MTTHSNQFREASFRYLFSGLALAPLLAAQTASAEPAQQADVFVDSIGVNVHFLYANYIDNFDNVIVPSFKELGIRHYRDGILLDDPPFVARLAAVKAQGATGCFITRPTQFPELIDWAVGAAAYIDTLEGPNEPHNEEESSVYLGLEQPESLKPYQQDLYAAVRAEPMLNHVMVATPGIDWFGAYLSVGDLDQWTDFGNFHHWPPSTGELQDGMNKGNAPTDGLYVDRSGGPGLLEGARAIASTKPLIATETGFATTQVPATQDNGWDPGVSEAAAARYATRVYLELFNNGVRRTYLYELLDDWETPQPVKKHQGLIRQDGSYKPHAIALKNMISLLTDPGPEHQAGDLDFSLSSTASLVDDQNFKTPDIHRLLLQKRTGGFYLILWNEAVSYDNLAEVDIPVADEAVTITLNTEIERARTFRPLESADPLMIYDSPTELTVMVPDHPLIVELNPPGTIVDDSVPMGMGGDGSGGAGTLAGAGTAGSIGATAGSGSAIAPGTGGSAPIAAGGAGTGDGLMGTGAAGEPAGCACSLPTSPNPRHAAWLALAGLALLRRRRVS